jgi:hypothetical protein
MIYFLKKVQRQKVITPSGKIGQKLEQKKSLGEWFLLTRKKLEEIVKFQRKYSKEY